MKLPLSALPLALGLLGFALAVPQKSTSTATKKPAKTVAKISYDRQVRPILSEHCFKCHGPDAGSVAAGVRLDNFEQATKRAIRAGDPDLSRMIMRVTHSNPNLRMPPRDSGMPALRKDQIEVLRQWIAEGAKYERHWSFVPPTLPASPPVTTPEWCKNPIDRFVLAKLDAAGLKPESEASRTSLASRASLTLTGLPPEPGALRKFLADTAPGAYERYVDRLLADPAYGEHQARYWLDAVRYGDTHGLHLDNERGIYPYRDWVVRALNQDLPFDTFTRWQLAGDLLPKTSTEQLIATGYVRMNPTTAEGGAIEEEFLAKNTFDRVDTTSTVFLGLTVACARCHDHKYDPISQKDYYRLFAFFNSTKDKPFDDNILLPPPAIRAMTMAQENRLAQMDRELNSRINQVDAATAQNWLVANHRPGIEVGEWLISQVSSFPDFDKAFATPAPGEPGQPAAAWKPFAYRPGTDVNNVIGKDNSFVYVKTTLRTAGPRPLDLGFSSDDGVRAWLNGKLIHDNKALRGVTQAIDSVKAQLQAGENELVVKVVNAGGPDGLNIRLADPKQERIARNFEQIWSNPTDHKVLSEVRRTYLEEGPETAQSQEYRRKRQIRDQFEADIPMTLVAEELPQPRPAFVLRRGEYNLPTDRVTRATPSAIGSLPANAPQNRLGLANWLTDPSHPLVSRVFVNRVWQQHFGIGLVKTAEDFGRQGEYPINRELLDYLAVSFIQNGWSIKKLHRSIVTSAAFRQASRATKAKLEKDPENRLVSRGPRFRLDAEVIRDRALAAGGLLVDELGGRGFKPYQPDGLWEAIGFDISNTSRYVRDRGDVIYRRSLYLFWKRTSPHPVMLAFDAPMREMCTVRRSRTNTPLQALTTLNEPAFLESSRKMAERVYEAGSDDVSRMRAAYEIALNRAPTAREVQVLSGALNRYRARYRADLRAAAELLSVGDATNNPGIPEPEHAAWMLICSTLMNTDEFLTLN